MKIFDMFKTKRDLPPETEIRSSGLFDTVFGDENTDTVNADTIMKIPTVQACINLICGTIAKMPIYLYKVGDDNTVEEEIVKGDKRLFLLNQEPNVTSTGYNLKYQMVKDYLIQGASYTYIDENNLGDIESLIPVDASLATVKKYKKGIKTTAVDICIPIDGDRMFKKKNYEFIICANDSKDGITGKGILDKGSEILKLAKNEIDYSKSIYENGALPLGVLKAQDRLSEDAINRLRVSWSNLYSGIKNSNKTIILEEGLDYSPMSLKPSDMQLDNSRGYIVSEICRLFNIPENLINPNTAQYSSVEQNNIHFLQYCIAPIVRAIEDSLNKSLLTETEKLDNQFFAFDTSEIVQTTEKDKMESIKLGLESGVYSLNEARSKANKKKLPTDFMRFSIGQVFYEPQESEMIIPNTNTIVNLKSKEFITKDGSSEDNNTPKGVDNKINKGKTVEQEVSQVKEKVIKEE